MKMIIEDDDGQTYRVEKGTCEGKTCSLKTAVCTSKDWEHDIPCSRLYDFLVSNASTLEIVFVKES